MTSVASAQLPDDPSVVDTDLVIRAQHQAYDSVGGDAGLYERGGAVDFLNGPIFPV